MSVYNNFNPTKMNFMSEVMGRINLDRKIKILKEEAPGDTAQIDAVKRQFTALQDSIPVPERQEIAFQISTLV